MCLLVIGWRVHPRFSLVVAANRDEFHARGATPMSVWADAPGILAGRDLEAGGTWLGIDRARRVGIVTNFRELARKRRSAPSRGALIPRYLKSELAPDAWLADLETDAPAYAGFNLLLADAGSLWYASNRADQFARPLAAGVHGLANHFLDTPWPKLERVRSGFAQWVGEASSDLESLFTLLSDRRTTETTGQAQTGLSPAWERTLSAPFVVHPEYGTRCTTVVTIAANGALRCEERSFDADGERTGQVSYEFQSQEWA